MANLRKTLFAFCSSFLLATNMLMADTIRFKNGSYIEVDNASEKDGQIEYWMGSTRYTIPKTKIEKIVKGGGPSITLGSQAPVNLVFPLRRMQRRSTPTVFRCPLRLLPSTRRSRFPLPHYRTTILIGLISAHKS